MPSLATCSILCFMAMCNLLMIESNDGISGLTMDDRNNIVNKHNAYRGVVNPTASNMRKLKWNYDLEKMAQLWADKCDFAHGQPECTSKPYDPLGQNLYVASGNSLDPVAAVTSWYNEVPDYTYSTDTCQSGKVCGHYTQVVWADTQEVGCGIKYCPSVTSSTTVTQGIIIVCNYGAAGNYNNVKPYTSGTKCSACPADHGACEGSKICTKSQAGYYTIPSTRPATAMTCVGDNDDDDDDDDDDNGSAGVPQVSVLLVVFVGLFTIQLLGAI